MVETAEQVVEADLAVPSGVAHIFGCMEVPDRSTGSKSLLGRTGSASANSSPQHHLTGNTR